jgi:hypothetical protein
MDQIFYFVQELVLVVRRLELAFFSCVGYCLHILSWNQDNLGPVCLGCGWLAVQGKLLCREAAV